MADLSPDLKKDIRALFLAHDTFLLTENRVALLKTPLSAWEEVYQIKWDAPPYIFFNSFIDCLPSEPLKQALQVVETLSGTKDEAAVAALCARIDDESQRTTAVSPHPLARYYQQTIKTLSTPRYQLDSRFVQLTLLLDQGPDATGLRFIQDSQRGKFNSLKTLLAEVQDRALVLLGRPGSGKTTLLRRLQLELAWEELPRLSAQIPFFVSLNGYGSRAANPVPDPATWLAQEWRLCQPDLPPFETLLQDGRFLFLLDGLNEIPHRDQADYQERVNRWQQFLRQAIPGGNTAVFSCRSLDYSVPLGSEAIPVRQVQVEALTPAQIEQFLELYLHDQAPPVWEALQQDAQQLTLFATPFFLRLLVDQVVVTGELLTGQVALLTGFVRRALHREIVERHHRLFAPGDLLTTSDVQQVIHNRWPNAFALPRQGVLLPKLETLAYAMQDGHAAADSGQVRIPEETALSLLDHRRAAEIIAAGVQLNVLDKELARLEIAYLHQLLQEYFAARVLAQNPEPERLAVSWRSDEVTPSLAKTIDSLEVSDPLPPLPATGWEETTLLAAAMAADQERFVADLLPQNLPLAARCAAAPEVTVSAALVERLQTALLHRIGDAQADLRARIAAAEALGELGDPRFERRRGPHGDYLLPPTAAIPGGTYPIGDDDSQYDDEKPAHTVQVAAFEIGVFPVTNAEYRLFMEAGGYEDERWWQTEGAWAWHQGAASTEGSKKHYRELVGPLQEMRDEDIQRLANVTPEQIEAFLWLKHASPEELEEQLEKLFPTGKEITQPEFWNDSRFNHPAQPVVGVSWFEARAYCAWLAAQTGMDFRLPAEVEWEAAAGGRDGREYAFGDTYDAAHCNTFETHIRRTTPVGVFPGGTTPEGVADLSGNVWEWTASQYRPYPYDPADGREEQDDVEAGRALRGGSWFNLQYRACAAYRNDPPPAARNYPGLGFRVVVRRPHLIRHLISDSGGRTVVSPASREARSPQFCGAIFIIV